MFKNSNKKKQIVNKISKGYKDYRRTTLKRFLQKSVLVKYPGRKPRKKENPLARILKTSENILKS
jgi:hypothetical protein